MLKLNLASGGLLVPGFTNVDDCIYPLAYSDVDVLRISHVLEHFGDEESVLVLLNWVDCLKSGGTLKIAVPDFDDLIRRRSVGENLPYESIIMGGQVDERDYHKSIWTYSKLHYLMDAIGLINIQTWQSEIQDCAAYLFSLNLRGDKK